MATTDARAFPCGCDIPPGPAMCPEGARLWDAFCRAQNGDDRWRAKQRGDEYAAHLLAGRAALDGKETGHVRDE